jgi:YD repeat-containing protein
VYELGSLTFDADGVADSGAPGAWRASYAYDALGRRISRQVPWAYDSDSRWTWYYHDGVRRVMEVNRDPLPQAGIGGNPEPQGSYVTYADREYIWGPDYVDERLWQVDRPGATAFVLQDANYNVVALVDPQGAVLAQYDYDPYGQPVAADTLGAFGHNRIGHQGLFADRYDADAPAADLAVGAGLLYYARNRDYQPRLGRWVQRDPNGSGTSQILLSTGRDPAGLSIDLINAESMFTDGAHLYALTQCSPTLRVDPLGAFGLIGGLMTGAQMADSALDAMDTAYTGVSLGMALMAAIHNYSVDQELDAERATDWTQHDHMYSQSPTYQAVINSALHDDAMLPSESEEFAYGAGTRDGFIGHHVATNKGRWGARFEGLLIDHGIHDPRRLLNDIHNVVEMRARAHGRRSGRGHHDLYHSVVFRECRKAMRGKQGTAAEMAFKQTVARLGSSIRANPDLLRKPGRGRLPSRRW